MQANWPNFAFGGRRHALAVSGGWRRTPAGGRCCVRGTAGHGRSCLIVNQAPLLPPLCCCFGISWRRSVRQGEADPQTKEAAYLDGSRFLEEVSGSHRCYGATVVSNPAFHCSPPASSVSPAPAAPAVIRMIGKMTVRVAGTAAPVQVLDPGSRSNLLFEATAGFLGSVSSGPRKKWKTFSLVQINLSVRREDPACANIKMRSINTPDTFGHSGHLINASPSGFGTSLTGVSTSA